MKIAIIDEGIDQTHPFFSPAGYTMPAGYPKGQTAYTNAKVIVARAFPPASPTWKHASKPFDPEFSSHGTHVAGIAAGNANTLAEGVRISGVAPRAYLGNYKALTIPTDADVGLDGNSPELVAAIEAAVADGMDVINMSLGEPEIEPSRDIVVKALGAAARAGVVPVVSAGNDFDEFGRGSIGSPAAAPEAITVGAVSTSRGGPEGVVASFSSGARRRSRSSSSPSCPRRASGSSPPRPERLHLALRDEHGGTAHRRRRRAAAPAPPDLDAGAGEVGAHADGRPGVLERPQVRGELGAARGRRHRRPATRRRRARVREPGLVRVRPRAGEHDADALGRAHGLGPRRQRAVDRDGRGADPRRRGRAHRAPGRVGPRPARPDGADDAAGRRRGDRYVVLTRGAERLRLPYWLGTGTPALASGKRGALRRPGTYKSTTRGGATRVARYRYPESPAGFGFAATLPGPERVFRVTLARPVQNFGVVVTSRGPGVRVEPRIVRAGDERRLTGYAALPFNLNPYLRTFGELVLAAGTILPAAGSYDVVFDSPSASRAGVFSFRYWVNDVSPPRASLRTRSVKGGAPLRIAASDAGSGVDPASVVVRIDDDEHEGRFAASEVRISTSGLRKGRHTLRLRSPTIRSRGTWRTSPGSSRTRGFSRRASSSASCLM